MKNLARGLKICRTLSYYDIHKLLPKKFLPWWLRAFLFLSSFSKSEERARGVRLRKALEDLGPIFVKFGQLLSTRPDLLPEDIAKELNKLQDDVAPFDVKIFKQVIEQAWQQDVSTLFSEFSESPLASASIAQVHCAKLLDGTEVVIKAVRPGIEKTIHQDIRLMQHLAKIVEKFSRDGKRLRPVEVVRDYENTILDELNLLKETANASQLRRHFDNSPLLYVPQVYWDFCRQNVLVMERIYGIQVTDIAAFEKHHVDRKVLAERGVEIFFTQVFENNFFHADMHPGNVYVDITDPSDPSYISLDMAIVGSLTREDQYYLARNLLAMFRRDYRLVAELHIQSGWIPEDTPINAFESAIRTVCEPIFEKPIKEISFGDALMTLFQTARRFNMPIQPQLVLLQKTLVNIEGLGRQLYPDLDLWQTAHPFLERWLKNRYHPKTMWRDLKRQAPEFLERLPTLPHIIFENAELTNRQLKAAQHVTTEKHDQRRSPNKKIIAVLAFVFAGYFYWPHMMLMPAELWGLLAIGVISLWRD